MKTPSSCKRQVSMLAESHAHDLATWRMFHTVPLVRYRVCGRMENNDVRVIKQETRYQVSELVRKEGE